MASVRIRGRHGDVLLVPARQVRSVADPGVARALARQLGEPRSPHDEPSEDELVRALLAGDLVVVELEDSQRRLDAPRVRPLLELAGPMDGMPEPVRPDRAASWVGVRVVDPRGRPVPWFAVRVDDPAGARHDAPLGEDARAHFPALTDDGSCVVTLSPTPDEDR
jgi:hypothetical protein